MSESAIYLSVIIPACNEAQRLPKTLRRLQAYLSTCSFTYEILVVLDGPTDDTRDVLEATGREIKNLKIVDHAVNRGKGYAVREGMLKARGQVRLFTDADNSTDISHLERMLPLLEQGLDLVICSRHPTDAEGARQAVSQAWHKRFLGIIGNLFIRLVVVRGIRDTQCGFKAFRDYAAEKIFSRTVIDGWAFDVEVLALARALKYRIGIAPANWVNDPRSHVKWSGYLQVLWETAKIRRNLVAGRYSLGDAP